MYCISCNCETKKYKCPVCRNFYCSVECFKDHKEAGCTPSEEASPKNQSKTESRLLNPFKTDDTVPPEKLEALGHSEELKNLLHNPHLRNFLKEVDEAPNAWKAIKAAMHEPLFVEFADVCLNIVEPPENDRFVDPYL